MRNVWVSFLTFVAVVAPLFGCGAHGSATVVVAGAPPAAPAPPQSPASPPPTYLQALLDLRYARLNLEHKEGEPAVVKGMEYDIFQAIDEATRSIKAAAPNEANKALPDPPSVSAGEPHPSRIKKAMDALHAAHDAVAVLGKNNSAGLNAAMKIEWAIKDIERGIKHHDF